MNYFDLQKSNGLVDLTQFIMACNLSQVGHPNETTLKEKIIKIVFKIINSDWIQLYFWLPVSLSIKNLNRLPVI